MISGHFLEEIFKKLIKGGKRNLRGVKKWLFYPPYFTKKWIKGGKTPKIQLPPLIEDHVQQRRCQPQKNDIWIKNRGN